MKKFITLAEQFGIKLTLAAFLLSAFCFQLFTADAQQSIGLKIYPLTNSAYAQGGTNLLWGATNGGFNLSYGPLAIGSQGVFGASSNILSNPFQIWRGRGLTLNLAAYIQTNIAVYTNGTAGFSNGTLNATMRYGSVHTAPGGVLITNWSLYTTNAFGLTGGAETNYSANIQPSTVDNMSLGQLVSVLNAGTNIVQLDPTNSYIGVFP